MVQVFEILPHGWQGTVLVYILHDESIAADDLVTWARASVAMVLTKLSKNIPDYWAIYLYIHVIIFLLDVSHFGRYGSGTMIIELVLWMLMPWCTPGKLSYSFILQTCQRLRHACENELNKAFQRIQTRVQQHFQRIKSQMPRRESARRKHPLARECDIIETLHMRLTLLQMTFGKHIERKHCCFFAGEVSIRESFTKICKHADMGQVTKVWLSCYLVLLSFDSKTR